MKVKTGDSIDGSVFVTLDGKLIGYLIEADDVEGCVVQQLPDAAPIRLEGEVVIMYPYGEPWPMQYIDGIATHLEHLAMQLRTGAIRGVSVKTDREFQRTHVNEVRDAVTPTGRATFTLSYDTPSS
jgi:hypothetical protein